MAALVQEFLPTYSSTEVRDLLFNNAIDIETAGVDRDAGRGIMMPLKAIESLGISLLSSSFSEPPAQYNNSNGFIEPGEVGDLNFTLTKSANTSAFTNVHIVLTSNTNGVTIMFGEHFVDTMNGDFSNLFTFATNEFLPCGTELEFTITVTYDGGTLSPQTLSTTHTLGFEIPPIIGVLGSPPPTSSNFISGSGLYFGRLFGNNTNLFPSTCARPPFQNITQSAPFELNQYHAYSFTNENQNDPKCVTVTASKTNAASTVRLNFVVYNDAGFIITNPVVNIIGTATLNALAGVAEEKTFSFVVPPGEDYLLTVQGWDPNSDGSGMAYTMIIDQKFCNTSPCPSTGDIVLSPPAHVYGVDKYEGTIGEPFSQTFSTSGGSGIYQYAIGNLPPGLTLTQNSQTATLSGIPTAPYEPGGFSDPNGGIWNLIVTDGLGCTTSLDVNAYYIKINPCNPVAMPSAVTSNAPICAGDTLKLFAFPTGQGPFTYEWSGPGGTFINEDTGTPSVINPVPGVYSVTISNFCGSVQSSHGIDLNTPPVVNISGPYNLNSDTGLCTGTTNPSQLFSLASATGMPTPTLSVGFADHYPVGMSTAIATAINVCGTGSGTIDVIVADVEPPTALCKNIKLEVTDGFSTVLASDIDGGSSDACTDVGALLVNGFIGGNSIDTRFPGLQLVTLTAIDLDGNVATCDAEVTVVKDLCPEGDDAIDSDNAGLPDACDCYPNDAFNDDIILQNDKNNGMDFDGIDDFLTIPNNPLLIPTTSNSMTFEAWINPEEVSGFQAIATSADVGILSTYHFTINLQNDKVRVSTANSSSFVVSNASIPANAWTHIAVVFTAHPTTPSLSTTEIYINGVSDNLVTSSFQAGNLGYPIILGNIDEFNLPYNGSLEEVRFWSSARNSAEIGLYKDRELSGMEADLEAYYNFGDGISGGDNTALTSVKDLSPNAFDASLSGFAQNGSGSNWINGNVPLERFYQDTLSPCIGCPDGIAMDFDGVDDHITIPNENDLVPTNNNSMTFEAWINPDQVTGFQSIVSSANNLSVYNLAIYLLNDRVRVTASSGKLVLSNASIPVNVWTHVAVVFTSNPTTPSLSTIEIYINGVLDNSLTDSFEPSNLGSPIILGNINGANWIYNGKMDELRFWSSTRTMDQISNYMNTQLTGAEENLVAYYNFNTGIPGGDNSSLTKVPDGTKYERDGTLNGFAKMSTTSNWVSSNNMLTAPENTALYFDGIDDYLSIPNQANLIPTATNAVTVEAWVFPEKASGISMLYSSGIFPNLDHQIFLDGSQLFVTGNGLGGLTANTSIPTFEWSHIAVVFNMTETRLYINGQLDNIRPQSLTTNNQGFDITFGSQANGLPSSWNFLGKMDDVRIWNEARSDDQIQENFLQEQSGSEYELAAYFNFNEGSPENDNSAINSLTDLTGNGTAILNGFAKTGTISNWVLSPFRFSDVDGDGKQDFCDDCIAPKDLLLRNLNLDGTYRATETITLGDGLNFPTGGVLTLRAPMIRVPNDVHIPNGALINVIEEGCEE